MSAYTLRNKIEESRRWYMEKYKRLGWQWTDEGLPYAIMDYHSCVGSVLDFTDDDWQVAEENGFSRDEVITLCEDREDE
mgnify:FL=1|jgi:hypothetical protein